MGETRWRWRARPRFVLRRRRQPDTSELIGQYGVLDRRPIPTTRWLYAALLRTTAVALGIVPSPLSHADSLGQRLQLIRESDRVYLQHDLAAAMDDFVDEIKLAQRLYNFKGVSSASERRPGQRLALALAVRRARDL